MNIEHSHYYPQIPHACLAVGFAQKPSVFKFIWGWARWTLGGDIPMDYNF